MNYIWRPPSLSELTPYCIVSKITQLGSDTSNFKILSIELEKKLIFFDRKTKKNSYIKINKFQV